MNAAVPVVADPEIRRVSRATTLSAAAAIAFCLFFVATKRPPFRDFNPFGDDPYDAVGSFGVQIALVAGVLSFARALVLRADATRVEKAGLVLRGNLVVLAAVLLSLLADVAALIIHPMPSGFWPRVLFGSLLLLVVFTLLCAVAVRAAWLVAAPTVPHRDLTPADAMDDLWTLVRVPVATLKAVLPARIVVLVERFRPEALFSGLPWVHPRRHPWRFATAVGLLAGLSLAAAQLREGGGPLPNIRLAALVASIFVGGELAGTLMGFALLGSFLGLRPPFRVRWRQKGAA
jgi:hypothetical protein